MKGNLDVLKPIKQTVANNLDLTNIEARGSIKNKTLRAFEKCIGLFLYKVHKESVILFSDNWQRIQNECSGSFPCFLSLDYYGTKLIKIFCNNGKKIIFAHTKFSQQFCGPIAQLVRAPDS